MLTNLRRSRIITRNHLQRHNGLKTELNNRQNSVVLLGFLVLAGQVLSDGLQANKDVMRLVEKFAQNWGIDVLIFPDLVDKRATGPCGTWKRRVERGQAVAALDIWQRVCVLREVRIKRERESKQNRAYVNRRAHLMLCKEFHGREYLRDPTQILNASHHWLQEFSAFKENRRGQVKDLSSERRILSMASFETLDFTHLYPDLI